MYRVYSERPEGFKSDLVVVANYLEYNNKFLFVLRHNSKPQGGTWGVPSGKLENHENPLVGALRELHEETGISLSVLKDCGSVWVTIPGLSYEYHLFYQKLDDKPKVYLNDEHTDFKWISSNDIKSYPLIMGAFEALEILLKRIA